MQKNSYGRFFEPGQETDKTVKMKVIDLYQQNKQSCREISRICGINHKTVSKIIAKFDSEGSISPSKHKPGPARLKSTDEIISAIRYYKHRKPSIYLDEIRTSLLSDGIVTDDTVPSLPTISNILRKDMRYTYKRLTVKPQEALTAENQAKFDAYVNTIMTKNPNSLHFFDECSVIKTSGNRRYGHALVGEDAIEIQRYASNANFTVNLLHGPFGIESYNIIEGPSNGFYMLDFFGDAMNDRNTLGNFFLQNGDTVVMDNCGFHHGRQTEPNLRHLLGQRGVDLVFQPPYHPDLNSCENCFKVLKDFLKRNTHYSNQYTEMAICDGLDKITPVMSLKFFRGCGYL